MPLINPSVIFDIDMAMGMRASQGRQEVAPSGDTITTEDGDAITTEDGDPITTE